MAQRLVQWQLQCQPAMTLPWRKFAHPSMGWRSNRLCEAVCACIPRALRSNRQHSSPSEAVSRPSCGMNRGFSLRASAAAAPVAETEAPKAEVSGQRPNIVQVGPRLAHQLHTGKSSTVSNISNGHIPWLHKRKSTREF